MNADQIRDMREHYETYYEEVPLREHEQRQYDETGQVAVVQLCEPSGDRTVRGKRPDLHFLCRMKVSTLDSISDEDIAMTGTDRKNLSTVFSRENPIVNIFFLDKSKPNPWYAQGV